MNEKLKELRAKIEENLAKLRAMLDLVETEKREFTDEEVATYEALEKETDKLEKEHERMEKQAIREARQRDREDKAYMADYDGRKTATPPKEFSGLGEFLVTVRFNRNDPRLADLYRETRGAGDMSMGVGTEGGFMVPEQFITTLRQVTPQEAIVRPRATVIPAGDPPDAKITMPILDQTNSENIYGGIVVSPVAEGGTKNLTDARFKEFSLEPQEIAGYTVVTDKLLRNWQAAGAFLETQFRRALMGWEDTQFVSGTGIARPLGVINLPCKVNVNRTTANQIAWGDINNMYARIKFGGNLVWIASQTTLPQLLAIADAGSNAIFIMNAANSVPATLYGIPVMFNDRSPALGSEGDLILADLSYYMIKDGSGPFVDASPHVYFTSNKTVIKAFWNVDGNSWLSSPLPLEGSTSNTVSPFVVLK